MINGAHSILGSTNPGVLLRDGSRALITHADESDAAPLLLHIEHVAGETSYLSFGRGQFGVGVAEQVAFLRALGRTGSGVMLKAVIDRRIVGVASLKWSTRPRVRHVAEFGVSVLRQHGGVGLGRALTERAMREAHSHAVTRVELKVRDDNHRAIGLYRSLGFVIEGRLRRAFRYEGRFYDELLMARLLDDPPSDQGGAPLGPP